MAYSARSTCAGSRYGLGGSLLAPFSWAPGISPSQTAPSRLSPVLSITLLPGPIALSARDDVRRPSPMRQKPSLRCRTYHPGAGILTGFPFGMLQLGHALGPTNPRLISMAWEPWSFRRRRLSLRFVPTTAGIFIPTRSTQPHGHASTRAGRPPTTPFRSPGSRRPA